jgi:hypothetical protein
MEKPKNPVIQIVIYHRQNHLQSTSEALYINHTYLKTAPCGRNMSQKYMKTWAALSSNQHCITR